MKGRSGYAALGTALVQMALLCLFAAPGCAAPVAPGRPLPVLGVDPLVTGTTVENHRDALPHWVARNVVGAVLLHVGANSGMGAVRTGNLAALRELAGRRDAPALRRAGSGGVEQLYGEGNFIRVAAELGVVSEVFWVVPFPIPADAAAWPDLKDYLVGSGLTAQEGESFRLRGDCYRGLVGEIAVSLCGQERLPAISEPVLLSVGAEFIPAAASSRGTTLLTEIRALFRLLREARYAVRDVVVAFSVLGGSLPPELRWVGEAMVRVFQDPSVVFADSPPERLSALQLLFTLSAGEQQQDEATLLGVALSQLETWPHDPAFLLYAAKASERHGGGERSLAYAEEACRMDRGYCAGLWDIGLGILERGDVEAGLNFVAAAERLVPDMEYGQLDLGIALMKAGKAPEALEALEKARVRYGAFPCGFLIGTTQLFTGDRAAARNSFDAALAALEGGADLQVTRQEVAQAIAIAGAFYREEGLKQQAERLENSLRQRFPTPPAAPR